LTATADFLPYGRQLVEDDDVAAVVAVLHGDYLTTGPAVEAFERAFADRVGADHAVVVSSGGAALHLAALSLDLGPGDAALVPSMTFVATANAARLAGAEVIFCDVDRSTGLMGPDQLEAALTDYRGSGRPRVALPVHLNGQPCDMAGIGEVAQRHDLELVEDACHALGGSVCGHPVGSARTSRLVMFSGHPVKSIAMGEGGILTTNDGALATRLRRLASHGLTRDPADFVQPEMALDRVGDPNPWYYEQVEAGLNYRASDIHCALGLSQLSKLDRFVARRAELAARYDRLLSELAPLVRPVSRVSWGESGWHLYAVQIDFDAAGIDRAALIHGLRADGIGSQVHYIPVHRQPYYRALYPDLDLPGADTYYAGCLSLPLFPAMADSDVDRVVEALTRLLPPSA
jgi:UDP-4-amino-4,6-dideoxy-N-acetyl-beta-L-altrosamine transaminase